MGVGRASFERNGVDRIAEEERTSTPGTFFVVFGGGSVGLGAIAFGWVGVTSGWVCGRRSPRSRWERWSVRSCSYLSS